jgi:predicted MFS family arabinose efflux permease
MWSKFPNIPQRRSSPIISKTSGRRFNSMNGRWSVLAGGITLAAGFLVLVLSGGTRHAIGLVLKPMAEDFAWERETIGAAVAVFLVISAIFLFIAGSLADRFPLRLILSGGLALCAAGIGTLGFVTQPWQVIALYGIVFGIGAGLASPPPVGVMLTRRFPNRTGFANAAAIAGMGLGQLIIIAGLSFVLADAGWRAVFIWLGIANLTLAPFIFWAIQERGDLDVARPAALPTFGSFGAVLRTPYFWLLTSVYALCGFQDFFVSTHVVAFALDQGIGTLVSGNLLAFMGLAGLLGVLAAGVWSDRSGPAAPTLFCFFLRFAIFLLILASKDPVSVAAFSLLYGVTFWITAPLTVVFVRDEFGIRNIGALSGFVTMIHHMCGGLGAWIGAIQFDANGGYNSSFAIMAGASAIGIVLTVILAKRKPTNHGET